MPAPAAVTVTVDGTSLEAPAGELVIETAERAGVFVPRFCYHPRMKPVGMCRMCLVEIAGPRGASLQPACFVNVAEGMEIITDSAKVKKAQDGVLEFLLVNHPLDCPVCDKGGECPLQDQTLAYGPGESRFDEEKRHFEKPIAISELVFLDRERCIQCARCTRFADEVAGEALIDFFGRGERLEVATFPSQPFSSYFSGNTVQICPVGALTATPYRFRSRPWDLEQVETTCTSSAVGCRVVAQSSADRIVRYLGIDSDPVNQGWLCDKGRFDFEALNSDGRLAKPLVRRAGELVEAGWAQALSDAAAALRRARAVGGPETIAVIGGARLANEDAYAWARFAKGVIGTDSVDAQLGDGLPAELVLGLPRATIDEAASARAVVVLGPDLREELPVLFLRLRQAALDDGLPIVELVPAPTALSGLAKATLLYRPGEGALAASALVGGGGAPAPDRAGGVATSALEAARSVLAPATGDGDGDGADSGSGAAGAGIVVVLGRTSLAESPAGVAAAASVLAAAWPGAKFLPALRRGNVHGALEMGLAPGLLPGRVSLEQGREWFMRAWGSVPLGRGRDTASILEAAAGGDIDTLVLLGADPLADFPDSDLAARALAGVRFIVAVDILQTASTMAASVVLPAAAYGERGGSTTNLEGRVTCLAQKVVPPGVAWPDWLIAAELAERLGQGLGFERIEDITDEIEALAPAFRGCTRAVLEAPRSKDGVVVPLAPVPVTVGGATGGDGARPAPALRLIDQIATPGIESVEVQGAPQRAGESVPPGFEAQPIERGHEASGGRPPLLAFAPVPGPPAAPPLDGYSLRLVSRRRLYDRGTSVRESPSLAPLAPALRVAASPYDLDRLGVTTDEPVRVRSGRGDIVLPALADPSLPHGVAVIDFGLEAGSEGDPVRGASDLIDASLPVVDVRLETV